MTAPTGAALTGVASAATMRVVAVINTLFIILSLCTRCEGPIMTRIGRICQRSRYRVTTPPTLLLEVSMNLMRTFTALVVLVAAVGLFALFLSTRPSSSAVSARTFLSDCINNYNHCFRSCWDPHTSSSPLPPPGVGYCWANCQAVHAVCVDRAFSPAVQRRMRALRRAQ